ncbi:MAG: rhodanese-like domain-containing protein [Myxococcales bacterium]|nr:rhodanese-like domain-containing protein [Myxococcales bacterium]
MSIRRVSPSEAAALVANEGYVYVDVRSVPEFVGGHPAGAYNVPVANAGPGGMVPNADFVAVMQRHFAPDARLVIGCLAGGRSARACAALEAAGFSQLVDQRAGWGGAKDAFGRLSEAGWQAEGLPSAAGPDETRGYDALLAAK